MTETTQGSDLSTGLGMLFGLVSVLAAVGVAVTAYLSAVAAEGESMQLLSGIALTIALVAGGVAIAAIHIYH